MAKKRNIPRLTVIAGKTHRLCVFRLIEIKGETVLKYIGMNEKAPLKTDEELNRFSTGFLPIQIAEDLEAEAEGRS